MPATETVALVTGIIGCATSLLTIAPTLRKSLRRLEEKLSYIRDTESMIKKFDEQISSLAHMETDLTQFGDEATTGSLRYQFVILQEKYTIINSKCMSFSDSIRDFHSVNGLLSYHKRYSIGKDIAELTVEVKDFGKQLNLFRVRLKEAGPKPSAVELLGFRDYKGVRCRQTKADLEEMSWLISKLKIIGVSGPIGIGKTEAVAYFCAARGNEETLIWVEASHKDDVKMLQMKLASKIGLSLSNDGAVLENACWLRKSLIERGVSLIVLDNLWKPFSLEEIGISMEENKQGIILISRSSSVCSQMGAKNIIELTLLSDKEAYDLLCVELGSHIVENLSDETKSTLKNVAEVCGGLPLAIKTVAGQLRTLNWNDSVTIEKALKNQLDAFREYAGDVKYIDDEIFKNFVLSYEQLTNRSHSCIQECFLYCTIYPRNTAFMAKELMEYWMWEGLFGEIERIDGKLREAEAILHELKDACLLYSIGHQNGGEMIKLHPFIWDMAVKMIKERPEFFIKAGHRLRKPLYRDWPENVERVSLMTNDINELRSGPNFSKLSTLLLQGNPLDLPIHNTFFNSIPNLKILNLSNTRIRKLPDSLCCLKNLIVLLLRDCWALINLPSLSEHVALRVLDISGSPISQLPCDISSELLHLNLSRTKVSNFPHSLFLKLYNLQELLMIGCDFSLISRSLMQDDSATCIEDVEKLKYLSILETTFSNMQTFLDYISSSHGRQLKRFKFCVGGLYNGKLGTNSLAFIKEFPSDPTLLPSNTLELLVMHCGDVTHLTLSIFRHLKILDVCHCANLKYLFKLEDLQHLQNLEEIVITHCRNMEKVIEQDDEEAEDMITHCPSMEKVVEQDDEEAEDMITHSPNMEKVTEQDDEETKDMITHCPNKEKVSEQDDDIAEIADMTTLPRLQKLTLCSLPQLQFFSHSTMKCNSLQKIAVWDCSKLQTFPVVLKFQDYDKQLVTPPGLKEVIGESSWYETLKEYQPKISDILQTRFVEKPPPEELISRVQMMAPSDS